MSETAPYTHALEECGVVAIGRNEGERLRACLESAARTSKRLVYVDSGSTDDSVAMARSVGAEVVELDPDVPFTAARARNAGFERLVERWPSCEFVQFVDGDCEFEPGWFEAALAAFASGDWAIVCGRRRERYPEASTYNKLCDLEWDTPIGEANACGGDAMMRVSAFQSVGGYSPDLIAGEEPELCVRLAAIGGRVVRIDAPMTLHDAAVFAFSQWWTRAVRAGHAIAEAADRHPRHANRQSERELVSAFVWAVGIPLAIALSIALLGTVAWGLLLIFPVQVLRIASKNPRPRYSAADNRLYALGCLLSKWPHLQGALRFARGRMSGRKSRLIEYKRTPL